MKPILSIVTGTVSRRDSYYRLLESVVKHTPMEWEMVVADDSRDWYSFGSHPNVRSLLETETELQGCVKAYNRAFREATGEWVIWLNDDVEVLPGYAETAVDFMENNSHIGLGALYYAEARPPFKVNKFWDIGYANFGIISRELGNRVGWFDNDLYMYGCDNSLAFKVLLQGFGVASIPGARVMHHMVLDQEKVDNQAHRATDIKVLEAKYLDRLPQIRATFDMTANLFGPRTVG